MSKRIRIDRAKPETQATKAIASMQNAGLLKSVGTNRNYRDCLIHVTQFVQANRLGDLRHISKETCIQFLNAFKSEYSQKTLDMHRQALQAHLVAQNKFEPNEKLPVIKSDRETKLESRAYTQAQVARIVASQTEKNALATEIAYAAGLRAHELLTIRPLSEQPADVRHYADGSVKSLPEKWLGLKNTVQYSVVGKGGLVREIRIPENLANRLEQHRLSTPTPVRDRNVNYTKHYDIGGGNAWSRSFSAASKRALNWSTGAHGLRHSYAQERYRELIFKMDHNHALEVVSQEMGHFREDVTQVYLR